MFYVKKLEHEIVLQPIHFGPKLKATIIRLLKEEVEGLALATYGYVVNVIEVPEDEIRSVRADVRLGGLVLQYRVFLSFCVDLFFAQCSHYCADAHLANLTSPHHHSPPFFSHPTLR